MAIVEILNEFLTLQSVLFIGFCLILFYWFRSSLTDDLPPCVNYRLPVVGHMLQMDKDLRKPFRRFRKKYGDVYTLYFGSQQTIVINGFETLKDAFVKQGYAMAMRPKQPIVDQVLGNRGLAFSHGETWKIQRRFALKTLRDLGMGKSALESKLQELIGRLITEFEKENCKPFDPTDMVQTTVSNVICYLSFGGHFEFNDPKLKNLMRLIGESIEGFMLITIVQFIPILGYLPGDLFNIKRILGNAETIINFLEETIETKIHEYDENNIDDYTSAFIKEMKAALQQEGETTFTVKQLAFSLFDLFAGGTDSTSQSLLWAIAYLVNFPEMQQRMYEEISANVGQSRLPSLEDKPQLTFVEAFIMELFRHVQLNFTTVPHSPASDIYVKGYRIPAGAVVLPDIDSLLHDEQLWGDPETFRPDRFIGPDIQKPEYYQPFFFGKRSCVGESLAKMEMFLCISSLVQRFQFTAPDDAVLLKNVDGVFGIVHTAKPYRVIATPRS